MSLGHILAREVYLYIVDVSQCRFANSIALFHTLRAVPSTYLYYIIIYKSIYARENDLYTVLIYIDLFPFGLSIAQSRICTFRFVRTFTPFSPHAIRFSIKKLKKSVYSYPCRSPIVKKRIIFCFLPRRFITRHLDTLLKLIISINYL